MLSPRNQKREKWEMTRRRSKLVALLIVTTAVLSTAVFRSASHRRFHVRSSDGRLAIDASDRNRVCQERGPGHTSARRTAPGANELSVAYASVTKLVATHKEMSSLTRRRIRTIKLQRSMLRKRSKKPTRKRQRRKRLLMSHNRVAHRLRRTRRVRMRPLSA